MASRFLPTITIGRVMKHIHVIPVDETLTPEEAWKELCIMGVRATNTGKERWAVIHCNGEECANIKEQEEL